MLHDVSSAGLFAGDRVHRRVYSDPAIFAAEMSRIFGRTWVYVAHESEVPNPGDFKCDTIGSQPLLLVRGADGMVRLFYNTCRHRGAKVCYEPYGNTPVFKCLYHGWTYDTAGALSGVPLRERFRDLELGHEYGLVPVPRVESYRGFVFASLAPDGEALVDYLGRGCHYLDMMCDRSPTGRIEVGSPIKSGFPGNWKLALENYSDNYHPSVLHQSALEIGSRLLSAKYGETRLSMRSAASPYVERTFGRGHGVQDFAATRGAMWMNAYANPDYLDALNEARGAERARELRDVDIHIILYPNLLMHMRMNNFRVIKPVAVDRTEVWTYPCRLEGAPVDVNEALSLNTSHHVSAMGEIQVDDFQSYVWVQEGVQSEGVNWILLKMHGEDERMNSDGEFQWKGTSEEMIRHQYREWARLMGPA